MLHLGLFSATLLFLWFNRKVNSCKYNCLLADIGLIGHRWSTMNEFMKEARVSTLASPAAMAVLFLLFVPPLYLCHHVGSPEFTSLLNTLPDDWPDKLDNWTSSSGPRGGGDLQYCFTVQGPGITCWATYEALSGWGSDRVFLDIIFKP